MKTAFVIMRIGDSQLDSLYRDVICPALKECGLVPRRVDKHEAGGLIKSEITALIDNAHVVIADLTGERPNCYLEVGYVMGKGKFSNLVLTARQAMMFVPQDEQPTTQRCTSISTDTASYTGILSG